MVEEVSDEEDGVVVWVQTDTLLPTKHAIDAVDPNDFHNRLQRLKDLDVPAGAAGGGRAEHRFEFDILADDATENLRPAAVAGVTVGRAWLPLITAEFSKPEASNAAARTSTVRAAHDRRLTLGIHDAKGCFIVEIEHTITGKAEIMVVPFNAVSQFSMECDDLTGIQEWRFDVRVEGCTFERRPRRKTEVVKVSEDHCTGLNRRFTRMAFTTVYCKSAATLLLLKLSNPNLARAWLDPPAVAMNEVATAANIEAKLAAAAAAAASRHETEGDYHAMHSRPSFIDMKDLSWQVSQYLSHRYSLNVADHQRQLWHWAKRCAHCARMCGFDKRGVEGVVEEGMIRANAVVAGEWSVPVGSMVAKASHARCSNGFEGVHPRIAKAVVQCGLPQEAVGDGVVEAAAAGGADFNAAVGVPDGIASLCDVVSVVGEHSVRYVQGAVDWLERERNEVLAVITDGVGDLGSVSDEAALDDLEADLYSLLDDLLIEQNILDAAAQAAQAAEQAQAGQGKTACGCCGAAKNHADPIGACGHWKRSCAVCVRAALHGVSNAVLAPPGAGTRAATDRREDTTGEFAKVARRNKRWLVTEVGRRLSAKVLTPRLDELGEKAQIGGVSLKYYHGNWCVERPAETGLQPEQ